MSLTRDWQVVVKIEGLDCPVALRWTPNHDGILNVTMNGDWYANVDVKLVDEVTAGEVKKGLARMYTARDKAKMPEAIRGLQQKLEAEIDAWFANPVQ